MTYNQTMKEISRLYELKKKAYTEVEQIEEVCMTVGHGQFVPTGTFKKVVHRIPNEEEQRKIQEQIDELEKSIKAEKEERAKKAKRKRYEKELAELKDRVEYLEKWLAEN